LQFRRLIGAAAGSASRGFTLIEMLVVLAIIALLTGLVAPRVLDQLTNAKFKTRDIQIENLKNALELFYLDNGKYPSNAEGLSALIVKPAGSKNWNGPYLKGESVPLDPWSNPFVYKAPDASTRTYSLSAQEAGSDSGSQ